MTGTWLNDSDGEAQKEFEGVEDITEGLVDDNKSNLDKELD